MKQTTSKSKLARALIWIIGIASGLALVFAIYMNAKVTARTKNVPSTSDYSTTRLSDKGLFRVSYTTSTGTVPVNQIHQWTLHVETADGKPVEGASIRVNGDMPEHGHGLPTQPRVTKYLGHGDFLVDGMKFQMGGWWVMDFTVTANGQTDTVHFSMILKQ